MVLLWMMAEVSPRCQYSDLVVTVRVTLQDESPKAAPSAVKAAMSTEMMILMICCLDIIVRFWDPPKLADTYNMVHRLSEHPFLSGRD